MSDLGEYNVSYGIDLLWQLGSYDFLNQLSQFADHLENGTTIPEMTNFVKYY